MKKLGTISLRPWNRRRDRSEIERWPAPSIPQHWMQVLGEMTGQRQSWAIVAGDDQAGAQLVGRLTLRDFHSVWSNARIGIYLRPDCYGQGIGTRALEAFMALSPVDFLLADVALDNERARRCYEKAGFLELYTQHGYAVLGRYVRASTRSIPRRAVGGSAD